MRTQSTEVAILGGGPAGLAAAIALRQRGIDCTVIEALAPGVDKSCGEGLMPEALAALRELGVAIDESDGHRFRGIRFLNAAHRVEADFPQGCGIGVRRVTLHQRLVERAIAAGAALRWRSHARLLDERTMLVDGEPLRFRYLVGADGNSSGVRRWAGLEAGRAQLRIGFRRHYRVAPWSEYVEVHWGRSGQIYVTPVGPECVCVVAIGRRASQGAAAQPGRWQVLEDFPELARRLAGQPLVSPERGAATLTRKLRRVTRRAVALVGDASGSVDAVTGEGLAVSFRQALALAEAVSTGDLARYQASHHQIGRLPHAMSQLLLVMDRWPLLEQRALRLFGGEPWLFGELLRVHVGEESLAGFAVRNGWRMGWGLMRPAPGIFSRLARSGS